MFAAFDAFHDAQAAIGRDGERIDALELFGDAEDFPDNLQGGAGATGGGFPTAEDEQF